MLEISLSKDELTSKINNRPFRVSINNYKEINGAIDMNCITNVMRGSYIEKNNQGTKIYDAISTGQHYRFIVRNNTNSPIMDIIQVYNDTN